MASAVALEDMIKKHQPFFPLVPFDPLKDRLLLLDFTENNHALSPELLNETEAFTQYISQKLQDAHARYGIGGYGEWRSIYTRSSLFLQAAPAVISGVPVPEVTAEPRSLHLGIDIWGKPLTPIHAPFDAVVHSFAFNGAFGDYGATIILCHRLEEQPFFTLYGHLSLNSIKNLKEGERIRKGDVFAEFGIPQENGSWPPHLHFQIIRDMEGHRGDYPGVCAESSRQNYLANCPDPDIILQLMQYTNEKHE